jgi:hypothetical protein
MAFQAARLCANLKPAGPPLQPGNVVCVERVHIQCMAASDWRTPCTSSAHLVASGQIQQFGVAGRPLVLQSLLCLLRPLVAYTQTSPAAADMCLAGSRGKQEVGVAQHGERVYVWGRTRTGWQLACGACAELFWLAFTAW